MPNFSVSRSVPYTADQVFAITRDVAHYKDFLPLVAPDITAWLVAERPSSGAP